MSGSPTRFERSNFLMGPPAPPSNGNIGDQSQMSLQPGPANPSLPQSVALAATENVVSTPRVRISNPMRGVMGGSFEVALSPSHLLCKKGGHVL